MEAKEAELDENIRRKDLTWQEHAAAVKELYELAERAKVKEVRYQAATQLDDPAKGAVILAQTLPQSIADTAREVLVVA